MHYTIDENEKLWRVTLSGTITNRDLQELEKLIVETDEHIPVTPNRLVDLRLLSTMDIDYRGVSGLVRVLGSHSMLNTQRVAFLVCIPIQFGYARMFQILSENWHGTVEVFENEKDALDWLSHQTQ